MSNRTYQSEGRLIRNILAEHGSHPDVRVWRQNVGQGWAGSALGPVGEECTVRLQPGDVVVRQARPFHAGLAKGSSDLIGLRAVEVTPEMVGQRIAQFTSVEVKAGRTATTGQQQAWLEMVQRLGGLAGIARSVQDAGDLLRGR